MEVWGLPLFILYWIKLVNNIVIVSGEKNKAIDIIAEKFEVETHQGIRKKLEVVEKIVETHKLSDDEWVYIGDDVNDYESLCRAKFAVTVPNAVQKIREIPNIQITEAQSGDGAFREVADALV